MKLPSDAKNGFWLVVGALAALYVGAIVIKRLP